MDSNCVRREETGIISSCWPSKILSIDTLAPFIDSGVIPYEVNAGHGPSFAHIVTVVV